MSPEATTLSEPQLDALREFGNIGSAHAATSLSLMIGQEIEMRMPELEVVPLNAVSSFVDPDGPSVGLYFKLLDGDCRENGHVYLVFPEGSALKMADMLLMREVGATRQIGEEEQSALMEVGNVLLSSFGDASAAPSSAAPRQCRAVIGPLSSTRRPAVSSSASSRCPCTKSAGPRS